MNLADELRNIEKERALTSWPETTNQLAEMMRKKAKSSGWGAVLIGVPSQQVEILLTQWAGEQGLGISGGSNGLGRAVWLVWGYAPPLSSGCDAEILANGSIKITQHK